MSFSVLNSKAVRALVAGTLAPPGGMRCHHSPQLPCRDAEEGTPLGGELGLQTDRSEGAWGTSSSPPWSLFQGGTGG